MRGRAFRRAQVAKKKAWTVKRRYHFPGADQLSPRDVGVWATTPVRCSCPFCSRGRRHHGPSPQERRKL